ncbi:MAG: UDP-N-acetylmuramoyl-tripeptide--D-alanyl-D-alanine ligase [Candidatus Sericytochromatia bacterium]|nr:UDP-N-acetylmuramoyl-tripeptide--D-alanyl-D-alanine ligase [Candidatus Sericytochromatia bacterium]
MFGWEEACEIVGGNLTGPPASAPFDSVSIDTRHLVPGALFACFRGHLADGHSFATQAVERGATGILAENDGALNPGLDVPVIRVENVLLALGKLAKAWRHKLDMRVIAITGSSGKTSTKEMIAAYLGKFAKVVKTEGNHNNELGVPLSLLSFRREHRFGIIEMGMRGSGEIAYLTELAEPDVGVITNIGTAHIERLGSQEAIMAAKAELWTTMPEQSIAIVPLDDPFASQAAAGRAGTAVTWSLNDPAATVWASDVQSSARGGQVFTVYWKGEGEKPFGRSEVKLPFWGEHHRSNALAALAVGWALGLLPDARLELTPDLLPGRSRQMDWNGISILDDSYNANPESMRAALSAFCETRQSGRKFAALGAMAELGSLSRAAHQEIGQLAEALGLDGLILVGEGAKAYAAHGPTQFPVVFCHDAQEAAAYISRHLRPGDRLLLKASRSVGIEKLIDALPRSDQGGWQ